MSFSAGSKARAWLATLAIVGACFVALPLVASPEPAEALSGSSFDPGYIISDQNFFDTGTMSESQIQGFLNTQVPSCKSGYVCLKNYSMATYSRAAVEPGHCSAYAGSGSESASSIIYKTAQACGINPEVLLVLLQKETGLITATSPTDSTYRKAMGYGCPDTSSCDAAFYGFYNQVYKSAWQFRQYTNYPDRHYQIGNVSVGYNPNGACGATNVNIRNQATADLYNYTPYQPNAASLANLGGTGDGCSSYGNRNFWVYYSNWFGSPTSSASGPLAALDSASLNVSPTSASIDLSGWAMDATNRLRSIEVDVYVDKPDGTTAGYPFQANASRSDIAAAFGGAGPLHGFSGSIPVTQSGSYRVCVFPITSGGGWLLECRSFNVAGVAPVAFLDNAVVQQAGNSANIAVSGWAYEPANVASATEVDVYVDRPDGSTYGVAVKSNGSRPDVSAAFGITGSHGFATAIPITAAGNYRVCAYAIGQSYLGQGVTSLGCRSLVAGPSSPIGSLDGVALKSASNGTKSIEVNGWAIDTALPTTPMPVHIYLDRPDGTTVGIPLVANGTRADVGAIYSSAGAFHGFQSSIPIDQVGTYRVCAFAIGNSVFGARNLLLSCQSVVSREAPTFGALDTVSVFGTGVGAKLTATGWAADPADPTKSIPVDVYFDGPNGSLGIEVTANGSRPDVASAFPAYGANHAYAATVTVPTAGRYRACAYAITISRFGTTSPIGCTTITVAP